MTGTRRARRAWRWAVVGFACGGLAGMTVLSGGVVGAGVHDGPAASPATVERGLRDVLHTPPLLVGRGQQVTLRFDPVCQADGFGTPCALTGTVFVRSTEDAAFRAVPLVPEKELTLAATLAARDTSADGIVYYAVIRDSAGESVTVPPGGAAAPERAWTVQAVTAVDLGVHAFGQTRRPDGRSAAARWGQGDAALGLIAGRDQATIGPSAFDVGVDGSVTILDQVNDRLAVYPAGGAAVRYVPIVFSGGEGDLAIGARGEAYVLDHAAEPVVRTYTATGALARTARIDDHGADMLRAGPGGALVHAYPGDMWLPVDRAGSPLEPTAQASLARAGRSVGAGEEVVVHATPSEALLALVRGERVERAWRVTSGTRLGEVQLAEPFAGGLLVVMRVWTARSAEFVALVLTPAGMSRSFAVDAVEWAESAALGRFRLRGDTLYQLRSAPSGAEIVTFDVGGAK